MPLIIVVLASGSELLNPISSCCCYVTLYLGVYVNVNTSARYFSPFDHCKDHSNRVLKTSCRIDGNCGNALSREIIVTRTIHPPYLYEPSHPPLSLTYISHRVVKFTVI